MVYDQDDFLEVLYDEFGSCGSTDSSSFRMLTELAHEGDYGIAAEVLKALVDDGHADVGAELLRQICTGVGGASVFNNVGPTTACLLMGELISAGAGLQAAELVDELMEGEESSDDPDVVVTISKMASLGHEDWVVSLCNSLFGIAGGSFAIVLGQMVESGLLPLASRVCLYMIQGQDIRKLAEIRSQLLECSREGCLELYHAMDSKLTGTPDLAEDMKHKISSVCGSGRSDFAVEAYTPPAAVLSCS